MNIDVWIWIQTNSSNQGRP